MSQVPDHFTLQYENNWTHLVQQMESRLRDKCRVKPAEGAATRFNQYAPRNMASVSSRAATTPTTDASLPVRWAYSSVFDDAALFDVWDEQFLGAVVLPTSETVQAQAYAWDRTVDQLMLTQLLGNGYQTNAADSGYYGGGIAPTINNVNFPLTQAISNSYVPFGGTAVSSGMTIAKIRRAKRLMDQAEVPVEGRHLALGAKELEDLLATTEVTNTLYSQVRALTDGDVNHFLGFNIVRSELIPYFDVVGASSSAITLGAGSFTGGSGGSAQSETFSNTGSTLTSGSDSSSNPFFNESVATTGGVPTSGGQIVGFNSTATITNTTYTSGVRSCVAWQKDMFGLIDGGKKAFMDIRFDLSHALQIRTTAVIGGARLQEKGVVAILSDLAA